MNWRDSVVALAVLGIAPLAARAQPSQKVHRVGVLSLYASREKFVLPPMLRELGYVEGRNIDYDLRFAEGKEDRLAGMAAEPTVTAPQTASKLLEALRDAVPRISRVIEFAARERVPAIYGHMLSVTEGGLMSFSVDHTDLAQRGFRRSHSQRREARRPPGRAADQVPPADQPENRAGARPHHPAIGAGARGSGHRLGRRVGSRGAIAGGSWDGGFGSCSRGSAREHTDRAV